MAETILKIKIMPEGIETDLEKLREKIESAIDKVGGRVALIEEQEVAFGLKALIATIRWPEEQETGMAEEAISKIEGVSSLDIIDYRRAFG